MYQTQVVLLTCVVFYLCYQVAYCLSLVKLLSFLYFAEIQLTTESMASSANFEDKGKKAEKTQRTWSTRDEEVLLQALKDAINCGWKSENDLRGYLNFLEDVMKKVFPDTDLRGNPHINSKIHVWKKTHGSLVTLCNLRQ